MSVNPSIDALIISGATMLLLHPRSFDYLSTYTASPMWTILVIGVIIWCVSFIIIGLRLKWLPVAAAREGSPSLREGPSVNPRPVSISPAVTGANPAPPSL